MNKNLQSDKKNNILMAAVKVLTNKGYYSSTMDDIVAESKMSKGAIYHYYSSKKSISCSNRYVGKSNPRIACTSGR